jgi:hypothetical protein
MSNCPPLTSTARGFVFTVLGCSVIANAPTMRADVNWVIVTVPCPPGNAVSHC